MEIEKELEGVNPSGQYEGSVEVHSKSKLTAYEEEVVKRYLKKVDRRTLPILSLLYFGSVLDSANIGAALVVGIVDDIGLSNLEVALSIILFYLCYILFEVPSNLMLKYFKPHHWFAFIAVSWSVCTLLLVVIKNGTGFVAVRTLMGALEAGLSPGVVTYLPFWYTLDEIPTRMFMFYTALALTGVFGPVIAYGFSELPIRSLFKYQRIFLFEGILTLLVGVGTFLFLHDYPETSTMLTEEERILATKRIRESHGLATKAKIDLNQIMRDLKDWKLIPFTTMIFSISYAISVIGIFGPTIINNAGFSQGVSLLLSALPALTSFIMLLLSVKLIKIIPFYLFVTVNCAVVMIAYIFVGFIGGPILKIVFLTLGGFGGVSNLSIMMTWTSINMGGTAKRLISIAVISALASAGNMVAPILYTGDYGPEFTEGGLLLILSHAASIVSALVLAYHFKRTNKYRDEHPIDVSHLTEEEQVALNDYHPNFRYRL